MVKPGARDIFPAAWDDSMPTGESDAANWASRACIRARILLNCSHAGTGRGTPGVAPGPSRRCATSEESELVQPMDLLETTKLTRGFGDLVAVDMNWNPLALAGVAVAVLVGAACFATRSLITHQSDRNSSHATRWLSWFLGGALLAAVVVAALHFSEERAFVRLAQRAEPVWLVVAVFLQAGTYVAQGGIWRRVGAAAGYQLSRKTAFELGLAKLFADQALPSAGVSSSVLIAKALEQRQVPSAAVKASVLINIASYHLAYVVALAGALVIVAWREQTNVLVVTTAVIFMLFSLGLSAAVLALSGHRHERLVGKLRKFPAARTTLDFLAGADARLVRSPRVLSGTIALQLGIVLLDAATVWALIAALGVAASVTGVFASFMIASLFRTMGIVPGGLGTFEATSVLMLRMVGVDLAVALAATLLFRGLSFWLPMLPGYWFSRRAIASTSSVAAADTRRALGH